MRTCLLLAAARDRVTVTTDYWRLEFDLRSGEARNNVGWSVRPGLSGVIPELGPYEYRILEIGK